MGELHLEIYIERMKREYEIDCNVGQPAVNYKETINRKETFDWLHRKQTGGQGQYARVIGYIEPIGEEEQKELGMPNQFENRCTGNNIPPEYYPSCAKGMNDAVTEGALIGCQVQGLRVVLQDGASHAVDSSDLAFRTCMANALRITMRQANPAILEPVMTVEVEAPSQFQGTVVAGLNKRMGIIQSSDLNDDGSTVRVVSEVPLANMFGYSTELRSNTQGKGEFSMEYARHSPVTRETQDQLIKKYQEELQAAA